MKGSSLGGVLAALLAATGACADEGMWTYDDFPVARMRAAYSWAPDAAWLRHVRLSSLRISQGCSASIVSRDGLVMTNEHCVRECLSALSDAGNDLEAGGYYAKNRPQERKCPALEADRLLEIRDVTAEIAAATAGKADAAFDAAERQAKARLESACGSSADVRCEVVTLYHGGVYSLYKYNRFQDLRVVFAPELGIANFGGDPDNFTFPRYDLDVAFLRIYVNDKPLHADDFLAFSTATLKEGDIALVSGDPGTTERDQTLAQLKLQRDFVQPFLIAIQSELRGMLGEFGRESADQARVSSPPLHEIENQLKFFKGRQMALVDGSVVADKERSEADLRRRVAADPRLAASTGGAWDAIAAAVAYQRRIGIRNTLLERFPQNFSDLLNLAVKLNRYAAESVKPADDRLAEYTDAQLETVKQELLSPVPIHDELERIQLAWWLTKVREYLGTDDADVHTLLGRQSPDELASSMVTGSRLSDVGLRTRLFQGGAKAIDAYHDPLLDFARLLDGPARRVRRDYDDNVRAVITVNSASIARARFALDGRSRSPDATFSPRLSYGRVAGYEDRGSHIPSATTMAGAYERATGRDPFALPQTWLTAATAIEPRTPLNFVTSTDVTGGNSGSPVVGRDGRVIGLIFDGNAYALGGEFGYDGSLNRAIAVDVTGIYHALAVIYHADRLTRELSPQISK